MAAAVECAELIYAEEAAYEEKVDRELARFAWEILGRKLPGIRVLMPWRLNSELWEWSKGWGPRGSVAMPLSVPIA